jgi:hypothetical protein
MSGSIRLYRYMSADAALKTIESRSFRVGRLHELNDPFEWRMGVVGIIPEGEAFAQNQMQAVKEELSEQIGILSFSDTVEESVLWAHYGDTHRGVAFEVEYILDPQSLFKMQYTDDRPVIDANRLRDHTGLNEYLLSVLQRLMIQKSLGWSYEREYRVFVDLSACDIAKGNYLRKIPDNFLIRVILGYRCPLEQSYVARSLAAQGLASTTVARAKMCPHSYAIRC